MSTNTPTPAEYLSEVLDPTEHSIDGARPNGGGE